MKRLQFSFFFSAEVPLPAPCPSVKTLHCCFCFHSKVHTFLIFLQTSLEKWYCVENLLFWLAVEEYKNASDRNEVGVVNALYVVGGVL